MINENSKTIIEMHGISKIYPGVTALDHVDLDIIEGEVIILHDSELLCLGEHHGTTRLLIRHIIRWQELEWNPPLVHQLTQGKVDVCVQTQSYRLENVRGLRFDTVVHTYRRCRCHTHLPPPVDIYTMSNNVRLQSLCISLPVQSN